MSEGEGGVPGGEGGAVGEQLGGVALVHRVAEQLPVTMGWGAPLHHDLSTGDTHTHTHTHINTHTHTHIHTHTHTHTRTRSSETM